MVHEYQEIPQTLSYPNTNLHVKQELHFRLIPNGDSSTTLILIILFYSIHFLRSMVHALPFRGTHVMGPCYGIYREEWYWAI
jgi:hypothetical protein